MAQGRLAAVGVMRLYTTVVVSLVFGYIAVLIFLIWAGWR
jgi:hypothetical protein